MANCDVGVIVSAVSFVASMLTLAVGVIYLILKLENASVHFYDCGFVTADCNDPWRRVFTLSPIVLLDLWTPVIMGLLGITIHIRSLLICNIEESLLPHNYVQYGFFMLVTALCGNFGYCGKFGVLVGILSSISVFLCIMAKLMGESLVKALQTRI
mmetsp:Transcript_90711/g.234225  ORF Transcript_90711/g.234225 Transcript_90711/m.234225 type:complete len:156 (-) Transcript_90711:323-790(-)